MTTRNWHEIRRLASTVATAILLLTTLQARGANDDTVAAQAAEGAATATDRGDDTVDLTPEEIAMLQEMGRIMDSLHPRQGQIVLPDGVATLNVPESLVYYGPDDAEIVLVDIWGNLPGSGRDSLGLIFPADLSPFENGSWAVTIEYEEDGFVSDDDADQIDYDELLTQMKADAAQESRERVDMGYDPIELIGWASPPYYDKASHKLHWAKELQFGGAGPNTLNYNIRVLGRKGVLNLNFVAGMEQKAMIDERVPEVLAMADFNTGSRYEDFDPDLDEVAAYGLGALVAGKVLAKTGLLAAALLILKKFGVYIVVAAGAAIGSLVRRRRGDRDDA